MYTFHLDKPETFKCQIDIEGANLSDTVARLVLKSNDTNVMFDGKISKDGICEVSLKNLKRVFKEEIQGTVLLEVIVDGTYFKPWEDTCQIKRGKKVTVEVLTGNKSLLESQVGVKVLNTPPSTVKPKPPILEQKLDKHSILLSNFLKENGVTTKNMIFRKNLIQEAVTFYHQKRNLKTPIETLLTETIKKL